MELIVEIWLAGALYAAIFMSAVEGWQAVDKKAAELPRVDLQKQALMCLNWPYIVVNFVVFCLIVFVRVTLDAVTALLFNR